MRSIWCWLGTIVLLFFITLIALESRESFVPGYYTFVAVLMLLVCWLAYAIANRFFAPDPKAAPDASHGLNMEADPESKLK